MLLIANIKNMLFTRTDKYRFSHSSRLSSTHFGYVSVILFFMNVGCFYNLPFPLNTNTLQLYFLADTKSQILLLYYDNIAPHTHLLFHIFLLSLLYAFSFIFFVPFSFLFFLYIFFCLQFHSYTQLSFL